ncbi:phasin family protein [Rhodobacteraceae bacterium NNCM2]|nr:phasin family protein [Coraliihabitans acroporae]
MTMQFPSFDLKAFTAIQEKNFAAFVEANKAAVAGYQDLAKRHAALVETGLAEAKTKFAAVKPEPVTLEKATATAEEFKTAFEKAAADAKDLLEAAHKTNVEVFDILKARADAAMVEVKDAVAA